MRYFEIIAVLISLVITEFLIYNVETAQVWQEVLVQTSMKDHWFTSPRTNTVYTKNREIYGYTLQHITHKIHIIQQDKKTVQKGCSYDRYKNYASCASSAGNTSLRATIPVFINNNYNNNDTWIIAKYLIIFIFDLCTYSAQIFIFYLCISKMFNYDLILLYIFTLCIFFPGLMTMMNIK